MAFKRGVLSALILTLTSVGFASDSKADALWVSFGSSDLETLKAAGLDLGVPEMSNARASVFRLNEDRLPQISEIMHDVLGRCGGFFAHETRAEAAADLVAPAAAIGGPYTIDQHAAVKSLIARVDEAELRSTIETLAAYNNRYYAADTGAAAARWTRDRWQELARKFPGASAQLVTHTQWKQPTVILTIPGAENPEEIVVLGGHLDSIGRAGGGAETARAPGADDNASGIAVLTEVARILGESGLRPRRTISVMGYAAEEVGLRGSREIARQYAASGKKVVGVIQFDMTNFKGSAEDIYLLTDNVDAGLTAFLGQLIDVYVRVPWSKTACGYACSDHASWTNSGYAAAATFEASLNESNRNIHSDRDTLANSGGSAKHSVGFAKLAAAFAVELAKTVP